MPALELHVQLTGPLFKKNIDRTMRNALLDKVFKSIDKRMQRVPKKKAGTLGQRRNPIGPGKPWNAGYGALQSGGSVAMEWSSSKNWPRTKGTSWQRKNVAIIKSVARRSLKAAAQKMVADLS